MTESYPAVSFIIPVKNDAVRLKRCLDSIARNTGHFDVFVGDNGSTDDSAAVAAAAGAHVLALPGLKVSEVRNRVAAAATGTCLAFVDGDHEIVPTWVTAAALVIAEPSAGAAGALYTIPRDASWVQQMYGALRGRTVGHHDARWLGSGNLVVRRQAFQAIGGFDATLEACEDVDLCQRLRSAGWRVIADERLESVHHGDPATLAQLFRAERWRGRDNLGVSLRGPLTFRDLPSVLIPVVQLVCAISAIAGLTLAPLLGSLGLAISLLAILTSFSLTTTRAVKMVGTLENPGFLSFARALIVASIYDAARSTALFARASHHRADDQRGTTSAGAAQ